MSQPPVSGTFQAALASGPARLDPRPDARAAIANAAQATGVDFNYLLAQARLESGLNPGAQAPTSSAAGLYQFTRGTWLATLDKHGEEHGLGWAGQAIDGGQVADPATRAQLMALRYDPQVSALMAGELANDNAVALTGVLGRAPDAVELYMAHFLGSGGATQFLSALQTNPDQSAAAILPKAAAANRTIFYDGAGVPRSVGQVMALMRDRVAGAMGSEGVTMAEAGVPVPQIAPQPVIGGPLAQEFAQLSQQGAASPRPTMAQTLADAFALDRAKGASAGSAPGFVHAAYGTLSALGL